MRSTMHKVVSAHVASFGDVTAIWRLEPLFLSPGFAVLTMSRKTEQGKCP